MAFAFLLIAMLVSLLLLVKSLAAYVFEQTAGFDNSEPLGFGWRAAAGVIAFVAALIQGADLVSALVVGALGMLFAPLVALGLIVIVIAYCVDLACYNGQTYWWPTEEPTAVIDELPADDDQETPDFGSGGPRPCSTAPAIAAVWSTRGARSSVAPTRTGAARRRPGPGLMLRDIRGDDLLAYSGVDASDFSWPSVLGICRS